MDPTHDRTAEEIRVAEVRLEIEAVRSRISETLDALGYKADVPARLADMLSTTASSVAGRLLHRLPSPARASKEALGEGVPAEAIRPEPPTVPPQGG